MSDLNFQPQPRQYPPPRDTFWIDVWKIALGIFLGSVISCLFCGVLFFVATLMLAAATAPRAAPPAELLPRLAKRQRPSSTSRR